jgi:hypothetical protein
VLDGKVVQPVTGGAGPGISSTLGASCNSHCSATCGGVTPDWAALWMTTGPVSTGLATPRGPALARPILLAVGLNVAAVRGLADIAGFHAVFTSLIRIQWP